MSQFVVFDSTRFDLDAGWDAADGVQRSPAGRDVATYLREGLARRGFFMPSADLIEGECAWHIDVVTNGRPCEILISRAYALPGRSPSERWAVEVNIVDPVPLGAAAPADPVIDVLRAMLADDAGEVRITGIEWISEGAFWERYAR